MQTEGSPEKEEEGALAIKHQFSLPVCTLDLPLSVRCSEDKENNFYSSDSDFDDEEPKSSHIQIRPVTSSGRSNSAATEKELKATVGSLTLPPNRGARQQVTVKRQLSRNSSTAGLRSEEGEGASHRVRPMLPSTAQPASISPTGSARAPQAVFYHRERSLAAEMESRKASASPTSSPDRSRLSSTPLSSDSLFGPPLESAFKSKSFDGRDQLREQSAFGASEYAAFSSDSSSPENVEDSGLDSPSISLLGPPQSRWAGRLGLLCPRVKSRLKPWSDLRTLSSLRSGTPPRSQSSPSGRPCQRLVRRLVSSLSGPPRQGTRPPFGSLRFPQTLSLPEVELSITCSIIQHKGSKLNFRQDSEGVSAAPPRAARAKRTSGRLSGCERSRSLDMDWGSQNRAPSPARVGQASPLPFQHQDLPQRQLHLSRGPSPISLSTQEAWPVAAAITEYINAYFKGGQHNRCLVKITGDLTMSFPAGITRIFSANPNVPVLSFRLVNISRIDHFLPNQKLLYSDPSQSDPDTRDFWFNMQALQLYLQREAELNPQYQVSSQDPGRAPLLLSAECQRSGTVTRVSLDYHCCPATAPSTQLAAVQVLLPLDHTATDLQCQPPASWNAEERRLLWKLPNLSPTNHSKGSGDPVCQLAVPGGPPRPPTQPGCSVVGSGASLAGLDVELVGSRYRIVAGQEGDSPQNVSSGSMLISCCSTGKYLAGCSL
ncbi:hypothetical protein KUCAC02_022811 [Chaenocephalus aceratus]|uniref:Uncharacterized protein n=1 Tax=Chaenocephalus aceratus TaxID=36190 RepID=A0ACB9XQK5_CHAAC|nr:hypothetical protein KUCAC02_022811 [Chaenocephalus aceratus]